MLLYDSVFFSKIKWRNKLSLFCLKIKLLRSINKTIKKKLKIEVYRKYNSKFYAFANISSYSTQFVLCTYKKTCKITNIFYYIFYNFFLLLL